MGKGARHKIQAPAPSRKVHGTLTNVITSLLGAVENMSLRLDAISSTVNGLINHSNDINAASGRSTTAEHLYAVDSERDIVGEFHDLKQTTNVAEYQEMFEELRDLIVKMNFGLSEGYFIYSFLTGLKQEIKCSIGNSEPKSLYHAYNLARTQEISIGERKDKEKEKPKKNKPKCCGSHDTKLECDPDPAFVMPDNPLLYVPIAFDFGKNDQLMRLMEGRPRNNNDAPGHSNEVHGTEAKPLQEDEDKFENLAKMVTNLLDEDKFENLVKMVTNLLGVVKIMSLRLYEISSTVNGLVYSSKSVDAASGKSSSAEPFIAVDSKPHIVREFHDLKQTTNVEDYLEKFEKLRDSIVKMDYGLSEGYLISSFLSGLKPEVRESIANRKPKTLGCAFNLARVLEIAFKEMTDEETKDKLMKDKLISLSGDQPNLQCKNISMFFSRDEPFKCRASVGERKLTVFISTGSEYSYMDTSLAIATGCKIEEAEPIRVDFLKLGYKAISRFRCLKFKWTMQGHKFDAEMRIVEMKEAYDIVLGANWVRENAPLSVGAGGIFLRKGGKKIVLKKIRSGVCKYCRMVVFTSCGGTFIQDHGVVTPIACTYMGIESIGDFVGILETLPACSYH